MQKPIFVVAWIVCAALGCGDNNNGPIGPLPSGSKACGGFGGIRCEANEICVYQPDADCGAADQQGSCISVPQTCGASDGAVCGCDGQRYVNLCAAKTANADVENTNRCQ